MSDYISRIAIFEAIQKKADKAVENHEEDYASGLIDALSTVTHFPAADVAPIQRGEWKPRTFDGYEYPDYYCSNCGETCPDIFDLPGNKPIFTHCPNCGARMREVTP